MVERIFNFVRHAEKGEDGLLTAKGYTMAKEEGLLYKPQRQQVVLAHSDVKRAQQTGQALYKGLIQGHKDSVIASPYEIPELGFVEGTVGEKESKKIYQIIEEEGHFGAGLQWWWDEFQGILEERCDYWRKELQSNRFDSDQERVFVSHSGPIEMLEAYLSGQKPEVMEEAGFLDKLMVRMEGKDIVGIERVASKVYHRE